MWREARDRIEAMHGTPLDTGTAARHIADAGAAFERGVADLRNLAVQARSSTSVAVAILRQRAEELLAEMCAAGRPT